MRYLAFTIIFALLAGCSGGSSPTVAPNVTKQQQASASQSMGLVFPTETQFLLYHRASESGIIRGPDDALHLKIQMPTSVMEDFISQKPLSMAQWGNSFPQIHDNPNWPQWQPSKIKKFRFQQLQLSNSQALNVLIDDDHTDQKVIYLVWFEI